MSLSQFDPHVDFFFIAGPCLVEGAEMIREVASELKRCSDLYGVPVVLKGSFVKANRTSIASPTTIGYERALSYLADAGKEFDLPVLTDVHAESDVALASHFVDVLQIPAFLSRQTGLITAAARSGRWLHIKKGQFMAPDEAGHIVEKARATGNDKVMICERGTTFGYHDLVVDMRGLVEMRRFGAPVVFDATHSTQRPADGQVSGGNRTVALPLARGAVAVGVNGIFFETHPSPDTALSDRATQIPLSDAEEFIRQVTSLDTFVGTELDNRERATEEK